MTEESEAVPIVAVTDQVIGLGYVLVNVIIVACPTDTVGCTVLVISIGIVAVDAAAEVIGNPNTTMNAISKMAVIFKCFFIKSPFRHQAVHLFILKIIFLN